MNHGRKFAALLTMVVIMVIVGYYAMTASLTSEKTFNLNKVYGVLLMATAGAAASVAVMHRPFTRGDGAAFAALAATSALLVAALRRQAFVSRRDFLRGMREHHAMALVMASRVLEKAPEPDLAALARNILQSQDCEIALMRRMEHEQVAADDVHACTAAR